MSNSTDTKCLFQPVLSPNQNLLSQLLGTRLVPEATHSSPDFAANYSRSDFGLHRITWIKSLALLLYVLFGVVGCLTNVLVLIFIWKRRHHGLNITNAFVLVLTCSDLFLCTFNIPLQVVYELKENIPLTLSLCQVFSVTFSIPVHVSCLTMLFIAIDRYRIILHPLLPRMSMHMAMVWVAFAVVLSLMNAFPVGWFATLQMPFPRPESAADSSLGNVYCVEHWVNPTWRLAYSLYNAFILFFVPLLFTSYFYARVYCRLRGRVFKQRDMERQQRTNKILLCIVVSFVLCWTPWTCYSTLVEWSKYRHTRIMEITYEKLLRLDDEEVRSGKNCVRVSSQAVPLQEEVIYRSNLAWSSHTPIIAWSQKPYMKIAEMMVKLVAFISGCVNPFLYGWLTKSSHESGRRGHQGRGGKHRYIFNNNNNNMGGENLSHMFAPSSNRDFMEYTPLRTGDGGPSSNSYSPSVLELSTKRSSLNPNSPARFSPSNSLFMWNAPYYRHHRRSSGALTACSPTAELGHFLTVPYSGLGGSGSMVGIIDEECPSTSCAGAAGMTIHGDVEPKDLRLDLEDREDDPSYHNERHGSQRSMPNFPSCRSDSQYAVNVLIVHNNPRPTPTKETTLGPPQDDPTALEFSASTSSASSATRTVNQETQTSFPQSEEPSMPPRAKMRKHSQPRLSLSSIVHGRPRPYGMAHSHKTLIGHRSRVLSRR